MKSRRSKATRSVVVHDAVTTTVIESVPARGPERREADAREVARLDADLRRAVRARGVDVAGVVRELHNGGEVGWL